jgi:hypothetical protein
MVEYMLRVARDETETTKARIESYTWLADRGFGKPTQTEVRFSGDGGVTVNELATELSREEVDLMIEDLQERIRKRRGDPDVENGL